MPFVDDISSMAESTFSNFQNLFSRRAAPRTSGTYHDETVGVNIRDYVGVDHEVASALSAVYTKTVSTRRDFLIEFDRIKPFYLIQGLLGALVEDALTPDVRTGDILQVGSHNEEVNRELIALQELFNFDQIVNDLIVDLLSYGEYTLRLCAERGAGITDIIDDLDQSRIVCFYAQGFPYRFLRQTERDIEVFPAYKFAHFCYGRHKLRVKIENEFLELGKYVDEFGFPYPTYARVGRPLFYGVISKLKELMVLEQLIPASKLNQLLTGSLVGLQIPSSMSPDEGFKAARRYEQLLNRHRGVDRSTGELTIVDIIGVAGKIRVLPQFGDKGQLQNINDVKDNRNVDDLVSTIRDIRETICSSMGFPIEMLFGGQQPENKPEFLKRYSRYLRKLKDVQFCIANGISQICLAHLANRGITNIRQSDIQVNFRNELVNIDELEKLEFHDAVIGMINNVHQFVETLSSGTLGAQFIDQDAYQAYLYRAFSLLGETNNFIRPPEGYVQKGNNLILGS
jgi:hypothetical protein